MLEDVESSNLSSSQKRLFEHLFSNDIPMLDLRAPIEFAKGAFPTSINIPLMTMKRLQRKAVSHLGSKWGPAHDRFVINRLFREGVITDYERGVLHQKVKDKIANTKKRFPDYGRFRLW